MEFACHFSLLILLNNDVSGVSIYNTLTLPSVFVPVSFLRALNKSFLINFTLISYVTLSISLTFKSLTLLKGFCPLVFAQEGSQSLIFKDVS